MPKVSVVLPTYQRAELLRGALSALLSQSLGDFELFVMDDGSTDHSAEVVRAFNDPRLRYFRREHLGIPLIVNEGMALCSGDYILVCHDHDWYDPNLLGELAGCLDRYPTASFAHCGVIVMDSEGVREKERYVRNYAGLIPGRDFLINELLPGLHSPVTALSMVRRSACNGRFLDPRFGLCADVELWLRLSTVGDVAYVGKSLMKLRERSTDSIVFHLGWELWNWVLTAKRLYLGLVENKAKVDSIQRGWRRDVDKSGLAALLKALEYKTYDIIPPLLAFVQKEGTFGGATALALLCKMAKPISVTLLRGARWARHAARALVTSDRTSDRA